MVDYSPLHLSGSPPTQLSEYQTGEYVPSSVLAVSAFAGGGTAGLVSGYGSDSVSHFLAADGSWSVPAGGGGSTVSATWLTIRDDDGTGAQAVKPDSELTITGAGGTRVDIAASTVTVSSLNCNDCYDTSDTSSLTDVTITDNPVNGELLIWDDASDKWVNATLTDGANVTITEGTGTITIASTDTDTTYSTGYGLSSDGTVFGLDVNSVNVCTTPALADSIVFSNSNDDDETSKCDIEDLNYILDHGDLTGFVANEHIDWTVDKGDTDIDINNLRLLDQDDMSGDSNVSGATQKSIKAYSDARAGGLEITGTGADARVIIRCKEQLDYTVPGGNDTAALTVSGDAMVSGTLYVSGTNDVFGGDGGIIVAGGGTFGWDKGGISVGNVDPPGDGCIRAENCIESTTMDLTGDLGVSGSHRRASGRDHDQYTGALFQASDVGCTITSTTEVSATWAATSHKDTAVYTHVDGEADVIILRAGTYRVSLNTLWRKNSTATGPDYVYTLLKINDTSFNPYKVYHTFDIAGGGVNNDYSSKCASWLVDFAANDVVAISAKMGAGTGSYVLADAGTTWNMEKLS